MRLVKGKLRLIENSCVHTLPSWVRISNQKMPWDPSRRSASPSSCHKLKDRTHRVKQEEGILQKRIDQERKNAPNGIRTRVSGVRGQYPSPLDDGGRNFLLKIYSKIFSLQLPFLSLKPLAYFWWDHRGFFFFFGFSRFASPFPWGKTYSQRWVESSKG